ncbi:hypothetical protein COT77_03435 [Candidatus Berkelbacteria bacterium CG10_big_fil_rev_8_21_14_0_10_41_12]|uniref:Glycosyltransferase RgtA/B/C/D-like domain-containing protein n=1 Tax=Candidatus Berkelbacteria bacterium CG10_big_fil_rev_8_21_14_0_10_41_12 TaxID=1974513 RepID=A0A2M6WWB9_9BACT|nr:MAG: hypothetical protein COT77_03435 [Candidatus Berkelbacteria bacterium CG10_big_fil_rev_8_21_14_0_10_41_12]
MQNRQFSPIIILVPIVVAVFLLLFLPLPQISPTVDEMVHLPSGYSYFKTHDFRFNPEHPSLAKLFYAIPLNFQNINWSAQTQEYFGSAKYFQDNWQIDRAFGENLLFGSNNDASKMIFAGRIVAIVLTLALVVTVFFATRAQFGEFSAVVASFFVGLSPIVLGHGNLTNTDIIATLTFVLSVWAFWSYLSESTIKNLVWASIVFSLAALSKYTFVILIPIFIILKLFYRYILKKKNKFFDFNLTRLLYFLAIFALILLACYFFNPTQIKYYVKGLIYVFVHTEGGHDSYLLGQFSHTGWWYYFPVAILLKDPIPTLLLIGFGIINFVLYPKTKGSFWFLAGLVYLLVAMTSKANLGVRHVLPAIVMFIIWASSIFSQDSFIKSKYILTVLIFVLALWQGWEVFSNYPNYISYFNSAIKTSEKAYYLTDSNLDWGQDGKKIADFVKKNNLQNVFIDYSWTPRTLFADYRLVDYKSADGQTVGTKGNYFIAASTFEYNKSGKYTWLKNFPHQHLFGGTVVWVNVD